MGTSIATTLWENRAVMHHAHLAEPLVQGQGAFAIALDGMRAAGMSAEQALGQITRMIDQQAYTRAADDIFLASAFLFIILIGAVWLTHRPAKMAAGGAAAASGAH
jgi:DHA2 family multidrug resistance protein